MRSRTLSFVGGRTSVFFSAACLVLDRFIPNPTSVSYTHLDVYKRQLVDDPKTFPIEIVRWPAQGWRPIDKNSGNQGGIVEGVFEFCWKGETLYARNNAVGDSYLDVYKRQAL